MPIASPMRNAVISFSEMTVSLLAVVTDEHRDGRRVIGFGFNSNGRYAPSGILRDRMIPRLVSAGDNLIDVDRGMFDPGLAWDALMTNEKPGGHGERSVAVGVVDMAMWDIVGKLERRPLAEVLADRFGNGASAPAVPAYAAGGYYYPDGGSADLCDEISRYLDSGFTSVKIKIGGMPLADDLRRIEAVLPLLSRSDQLAVDANGRLPLAEAIAYTEAIEPYRLRWFEEPGDPIDFELHQRVAARSRTAIATGENLFSLTEVMNLLRYGGLMPDRDILQMDPALGYGLIEYVRMLAAIREFGWSETSCIPHGGHQLNLAVAAGLGLGGVEAYPGHFLPFGGFADGLPIVEGMAQVGDDPGLGLESKADLYKLMNDLVKDAN